MNRSAVGEPKETVQADFIVCGAGGAGLAAALQADDLGLNVVCLEKKAWAGGTFAFAAVCYAPNNPIALEKGATVDVGEAIDTILTYNHYVPSYMVLKNFIEESPKTVEWAIGIGGEFTLPDNYLPDRAGSVRYDGDRGADGTSGGRVLIQVLIDEAERRGLDIRYSTAAQELIQDDGGKVTGVLAVTDNGKVIKFEAPAVFLCTGGWGSNPDFLRELGRVNPDRVTYSGFDGRDGDGVYMARKAGTAWARGDDTIMFYGPHMPGAVWGNQLHLGIYQQTLWVNEKGKRFMNEGGGNQMEIGSAIRDLERLLIIQSQADVDWSAENGIMKSNGQGGTVGLPLDEFKDALQREIDAGNERVFVANTIEELATSAGLDSATFQATINRYNELVEKGVDEDFRKDPSYLTPLKEGPFYAFDCDDGFYTTVGGVNINENMQAVDDNEDVIEGLYVGGCDTGALCGDIYDYTSAPGEQSSWSLTSGRLAAKHVAEMLKK
jgi:fumarate reductase flavoprotein subunit